MRNPHFDWGPFSGGFSYEDIFRKYNTKTPTKDEELALGLTYGDASNAYAQYGINDYKLRIYMNQTLKNQVVEYMKERYLYHLNRIQTKIIGLY